MHRPYGKVGRRRVHAISQIAQSCLYRIGESRAAFVRAGRDNDEKAPPRAHLWRDSSPDAREPGSGKKLRETGEEKLARSFARVALFSAPETFAIHGRRKVDARFTVVVSTTVTVSCAAELRDALLYVAADRPA